MMCLTYQKLILLWEQLKRLRSLFSDISRGNVWNFVNYITSTNTLWLEIWSGSELVGIVTCEGMDKIVDIEAHVLFLDNGLTEKVPVSKAIIAWLFDNFPIQRVSVQVPERYPATIRFVYSLGFKGEGKKREAVLIEGKWVDVRLFGITRREAISCRS